MGLSWNGHVAVCIPTNMLLQCRDLHPRNLANATGSVRWRKPRSSRNNVVMLDLQTALLFAGANRSVIAMNPVDLINVYPNVKRRLGSAPRKL